MISPIFIIGVPRSGTTFLRALLDSHSKIAAAPDTPWIMGGNGPGSLGELAESLINPTTEEVNKLSGIASKDIYDACKLFVDRILSTYLESKNKKYLVLKALGDINKLDALLQTFPDSKFIHIVRDGRDVAFFTVRNQNGLMGKEIKGYGDINIENAAKRWHDWENKIYDLIVSNNHFGFLEIRYEDLMLRTRETMQYVFDFIGVELDESIAEYEKHKQRRSEWEASSFDVAQGTTAITDSISKWKSQIHGNELARIQLLYSDVLLRYNYELIDAIEEKTAPIYHDTGRLVVDEIIKHEISKGSHRAGTVSNTNLRRIEKLIIDHFDGNKKLITLETGCGKTTVLLSNYANQHNVFCIDDRSEESSSLQYLMSFPELKRDAIKFIYGPTQSTLPGFRHSEKYDIVLLDGPHGYPFPDLEYYHLYPHIKENGLLLIDDIQIPSIGRMFDLLKEDAMFIFIGLIGYMGVLARDNQPLFDPFGDDWWTQNYNRRRTDVVRFQLHDNGSQPSAENIISNKRLLRKYQLFNDKNKAPWSLFNMPLFSK